MHSLDLRTHPDEPMLRKRKASFVNDKEKGESKGIFGDMSSGPTNPSRRLWAPLMMVLLAALFISASRLDDPRCIKYRNSTFCPSRSSIDSKFPADPTACYNLSYCPRCLTGPVWDTRLTELGLGQASRSAQFYLKIDNWLSAEIMDTITFILLKETMGFPVESIPTPGSDGTIEILCCNDELVEWEKWQSGVMPSDDGFFTLSTLPVGYEGMSGLYVPEHTLKKYPLATAWGAYVYLPQYKTIFPKAFSTPCEMLLVDDALGCVAGNYVCDTNTWTHTSCDRGRYVPPQCVGNPNCQEIWHADPNWDSGYFEALIRNLKLNFTIAYLGVKNLGPYVRQRKLAGDDFMFYWYEPDCLVTSVGAKSVTFEPSNLQCQQSYSFDPTLSGINCQYPKTQLLKIARRSLLAKDKDLKFFFESLSIGGVCYERLALAARGRRWQQSRVEHQLRVGATKLRAVERLGQEHTERIIWLFQLIVDLDCPRGGTTWGACSLS